ncbi:MAG TPA: glycosyltransferase family 39 protein, partial [Patescibacteria group bacterium]
MTKTWYWYILLFSTIFFVGAFLRFYLLGSVPNGFYQDESAIGYNAYSILKTGKDEWGKVFPLYFESFGDYKLPVYIYSTIPSIMIFGMNEFAVRFPSALFGTLTVALMFFLTKKLTKNVFLSFLAMGFFAFNPWSLHYNRATFEVSISLFLFVAGTLLLLESTLSKYKGLFLIGTLCFVLSIYSYNLTRLLSPLLYLSVVLYLLFDKKHFPKKEVIITSIISVIFLIPFIYTLFSKGGVASARGTLIFSSAVVKAPLVEFKSYLVSSPFLGKLFSMPILILWQYVQNIAAYFSVNFLFLTGSTHGNHGIGDVGQFYLFE